MHESEVCLDLTDQLTGVKVFYCSDFKVVETLKIFFFLHCGAKCINGQEMEVTFMTISTQLL